MKSIGPGRRRRRRGRCLRQRKEDEQKLIDRKAHEGFESRRLVW